jgi:hypothetical protein
MKMLNAHIEFGLMNTVRSFCNVPEQYVEGTPGVFAVTGAGDGELKV